MLGYGLRSWTITGNTSLLNIYLRVLRMLCTLFFDRYLCLKLLVMKVIPCDFLTQHGNAEFQILVGGVPLAIMTHRKIEIPKKNRHVHEFRV